MDDYGDNVWCELESPCSENGRVRLPLIDLGAAGASLRVERDAVLVPGMRLPGFTLEVDGERRAIAGASVRYVTALGEGVFRAGLRFDDHQYVYPLFQFAASPLQGERGVLRHLDGMLHALGERMAWEKALFLLAAHPRLGGQTPVEVLREKPSPDVLDRLYLLAQHAGEMGA